MGIVKKGYHATKGAVHKIARTVSPTYRILDNRYQKHKKKKQRRKMREREREYHRGRRA